MSTPRPPLLLAGLLFLAVVIVFRPALDCGFINFDDPIYVQNNPIVRGDPLDAFTHVHAGYWIPLTWLSYQLDYRIGGLHPPGYHRTNVLLHGLTASFLLLVLARLTRAPGRSFVVAVLFAVHPVQVESVAWVTERKDVLSTLFLVLTVGAYARYTDRPGPGRYLLVVLCFVLGLMAKPMLVTVPVLLLLLDYWPLRRWEKRSLARLLLEKLPLFAIALAAGVLTILTQKQGTAVRSLEELSLYARLGNVVVGYIVYLRLLLWPHPLAVFYPHPGDTLPVGQVIVAGLLFLALTLEFLRSRKDQPYLITGWLWYVVALGPVSGILQAGWQGQANRFLYVPSIGLFVLMVWLVHDLLSRLSWRLAIGAGVLLVGCVILTRGQLRHWRDSLTLWQHTVAVTPPNFTALDSLAAALLDHAAVLRQQGRPEEASFALVQAIERLKEAQELQPGHDLAPYLLGVAFREQNRLHEAEESLRRVLELNPGSVETHALLAEVLAGLDQFPQAEQHADRALNLSPESARAHQALGTVRLRQKRKEESLKSFSEAVRLDPHAPGPREHLILLLRELGRPEEAAEHERILRKYHPDRK